MSAPLQLGRAEPFPREVPRLTRLVSAAALVAASLLSTVRTSAASPPDRPHARAGDARAEGGAATHSARSPSPAATTEDRGLLAPFGGFALVGGGAPHLFEAQVLVTYARVVALGGSVATLPELSLTRNLTLARDRAETEVRVFPFRGSFFFGLGAGLARTRGTLTQQLRAFRSETPAKVSAYVDTTLLEPKIGWTFRLPLHLALGVDAGLEIPVATRAPVFVTSQYGLNVPTEGRGTLSATVRRVGALPVPVLALRLGMAL